MVHQRLPCARLIYVAGPNPETTATAVIRVMITSYGSVLRRASSGTARIIATIKQKSAPTGVIIRHGKYLAFLAPPARHPRPAPAAAAVVAAAAVLFLPSPSEPADPL